MCEPRFSQELEAGSLAPALPEPAPRTFRRSACTVLLPNGDGGRATAVLTGGHWDGALVVSSELGRNMLVALQHSRTITCVAMDSQESGSAIAT